MVKYYYTSQEENLIPFSPIRMSLFITYFTMFNTDTMIRQCLEGYVMNLCVLCGLVFSSGFEVCPFCLADHEEEEGIQEHLEDNTISFEE
jgi:hypothetical protein